MWFRSRRPAVPLRQLHITALRIPAAVEHIRAAAGMDIGDTLIGMHLKEVAVPVRIERRQIGAAG